MLFSYEFDFQAVEHVFLRGHLVERLKKGHTFKDDIYYCIWSVEEVMEVGGLGLQQQLLVETNMSRMMVRECTRRLLQFWARELWVKLGYPQMVIGEAK